MTIKSINKTDFIRVQKDRDYTTINNTCLKDDRLSWKAKGIMAYILTLPDDWVINLEEIITHAPDGEKSFRSGFNELKKYGYVERIQVRDDDTKKIVGWHTIIKEKPAVEGFEPHAQKLHVGKQHVGKQHVGNEGLLSTNNTNYLKELNTNNTKENKDMCISTKSTQVEDEFNQFWKVYPRKMDRKAALTKFKTARKNHDFSVIIKGTEAYANYVTTNRTEKNFIKLATTFLNQESFLNDYVVEQNIFRKRSANEHQPYVAQQQKYVEPELIEVNDEDLPF